MIDFEIMESEKVVVVSPKGALQSEDFSNLAKEVDPFIDEHGELNGLMIQTEKFPGWENFSAFLSHFRFVRDHHRYIKKVALVTDAKIGPIMPGIGEHFVSAELKHFEFSQREQALNWLGILP